MLSGRKQVCADWCSQTSHGSFEDMAFGGLRTWEMATLGPKCAGSRCHLMTHDPAGKNLVLQVVTSNPSNAQRRGAGARCSCCSFPLDEELEAADPLA